MNQPVAPHAPTHYRIVLTICCWLVLVPPTTCPAQNNSDVVMVRGEAPLSGTITEITAEFVKLEQRSREEKIELPKIERIQWAKEPAELKGARDAARKRDWADARSQLDKLASAKPAELPQGPKTEILFLDGYVAAHMALAGDAPLDAARNKLFAFAKDNRDSIHYFPAVELLAELEWARGDVAAAVRFYHQSTKSPWPGYQRKSWERQARILFAAQKFDDAHARWKSIVDQTEQDANYRALAETGMRACDLAQGKTPAEEAIREIQQRIRDTNPDDESTLAGMYVSLGYAHLSHKQSPDALLAFMHVDTLFSQDGDNHAEALAQLIPLWEELGRQDRVRDAQTRLKDLYGGTYWGRDKRP